MKIIEGSMTIDEIIEKLEKETLEEAQELRKKIDAIEDSAMRTILTKLRMNVWKRTNLNSWRIIKLEWDLGRIEKDSEKYKKFIKDIETFIEGNPLDVA